MKKDVYWFPHDANARRDPKISMMRLVYGAEGYGWYWMLIELMREEEEHKLKLTGKYTMTALAKELDNNCNANALQKYIEDCINDFELFQSDGEFFWSPSLKRRMAKYHETVEKRREAAAKRWNKEDANAMQMHTTCTPNAEHEQCTTNAIRGEEIRGDKIREEEIIGEDRKGSGKGKENQHPPPTDDQLREFVLSTFGDIIDRAPESEREIIIQGQVNVLKKRQALVQQKLRERVSEDGGTMDEYGESQCPECGEYDTLEVNDA